MPRERGQCAEELLPGHVVRRPMAHPRMTLVCRWPSKAVPQRFGGANCPSPTRIEGETGQPIRSEFLMQAIGGVYIDAFDTLVMAEAGNSFAWCNHLLRFQKPNRCGTSPHDDSMGDFAADVVGAATDRSAKKAVAVVGRGAMLMLNEVTLQARGAKRSEKDSAP